MDLYILEKVMEGRSQVSFQLSSLLLGNNLVQHPIGRMTNEDVGGNVPTKGILISDMESGDRNVGTHTPISTNLGVEGEFTHQEHTYLTTTCTRSMPCSWFSPIFFRLLKSWTTGDSISRNQSVHQPTARVVAVDGSLREFPIPVSVSDVLGTGHRQDSFFLCSSDTLFYDTYIPRLKPGDWLVSGQIYFVLPSSMLDVPLTSLDMAVLAVKASCALASAVKYPGRRRARVVPAASSSTEFDVGHQRFNEATLGSGSGIAYVDDGQGYHASKDNKKMKMVKSVSMRMRLRTSRRIHSRQRLGTIDEADE
ncbi:hypothetical protein J5N97_006462 [Dioscorea zingiberensis]|uniref:Uncharacterized protein n=1 Tax=Dioscorea zingiberensis TaxID=325984 RepID=A0A9D5DAB5_9LILI|nr:hypothetical protein J5N97_006462 [Dioscorea zingiberensis]